MSDDAEQASLDEVVEEYAEEEEEEVESDKNEFDWGDFGKPPSEWGTYRFEELFSIRKDSVDPDELDESTELKLYSMPSYDEGQKPEMTEASNVGSKKFKVPENTILFPKLNISKRRFWLVSGEGNDRAVCSTEYQPLVPEEELNLAFFHQYFDTNSFITRPRLSTSSTTNSHQRIKLNLLRKIKLPLPPFPEQRKIASVLYNVDEAIRKTEEIIEGKKRVKKGVMQELLTEGIENSEVVDTGTKLGRIPERWEVTTVEDIVADEENAFTDGARYSLSSAEIHEEGEARAVLLQEVGEGVFDDSEPKFATEEKYEEITHRAIYPGEVVVAKMAEPVARACIIPDTYDKYLLGCADVVRIVTNDEFDDRFLMYCMNSHKLWSQAVAHLRGTGRDRINLENIAELKLPKPSLSEQIEIANTLRQFDRRVENEQDYAGRLHRLKRALMQDLLTGEVRTNDRDIEVLPEVEAHG